MRTSVLWSTLLLQMKNSFVRPMFRFCLIANPILNTVLLHEMYQNSGGDSFTAFVVLGAGLMGLWGCICFSSAGDINRERYSGTLGLLFASPTSFRAIILGKILGNTLLSLGTLGISLLTALVLYREPVSLGSPWYFLLALLGAVVSFITVSAVFACLLTLSRRTTLYMNCIEIPIILICGFAFPVEILPRWLLPVSYALSPTWAVKLLRMAVVGVEDPAAFWGEFTILMVLSAATVLLSTVLYRAIDRQVRIHATLEVS